MKETEEFFLWVPSSGTVMAAPAGVTLPDVCRDSADTVRKASFAALDHDERIAVRQLLPLPSAAPDRLARKH